MLNRIGARHLLQSNDWGFCAAAHCGHSNFLPSTAAKEILTGTLGDIDNRGKQHWPILRISGQHLAAEVIAGVAEVRTAKFTVAVRGLRVERIVWGLFQLRVGLEVQVERLIVIIHTPEFL